MSSSFPLKNLKDGSPNPDYIDLLEEDKPISQQKFYCMSFISPDNIIKDKNIYFFNQFLKTYEATESMEKFANFMAFLSEKYNLSLTTIQEDLNEFCEEEKEELQESDLLDKYKNFLDRNEERLQENFNKANHFQTNVRGVKMRGVFPTQEEAEMKAKSLREGDEYFDVYVGPVGIWVPWEPDAYKTGKVEHLEEELNQLMSKKKANEIQAKEYFDQRVKAAKRKAIEENIKKAEETGALLTQTIDDDGNLISLKEGYDENKKMLGFESRDTVKDEIFESQNINTHTSMVLISEEESLESSVIAGGETTELTTKGDGVQDSTSIS